MQEGLVLGIETSGPVGSVAVLPGPGAAAVESRFEKGMIHGVALAPAVADLLARAPGGVGAVSLVAVGIGPGSYTGVRVGVAFAKSFAFAAGIPAVGVCSHDAVAVHLPGDRPAAVIGDARRGTVYLSVFTPGPDGLVRTAPVSLVTVEEAPGLIPADARLVGDGLDVHPDLLSGEGSEAVPRELWRSPAGTIALLGERRVRETGPDDIHDVAPLYLRPTEAEERRGRLESQ